MNLSAPNVPLKTGKVSGVAGPQGVPAWGPINVGSIYLTRLGPSFNGGSVHSVDSPLRPRVKNGKWPNHTHLSKLG